jgi:hypothetical protein
MSRSPNDILFGAVMQLLRPLVRILLRNGVPYGTFADLARRVYVDIATEEFGIPGRKQSVSRVSVITGLTRKEVSRVRALPSHQNAEAVEKYNRAARVISGWVRDQRFTDSQGNPNTLPLDGSGSFNELVRLYSGDVPSRAVLDELIRVGVVERVTDGRIALLSRAYVPNIAEADKLGILGTDVGDLITTIDHNLRSASSDRLFQRKVSYDNLPGEALPELRRLTAQKGQAFLEEMDRWLSRHDRDVNPATKGGGRKRAGLSLYYFEEDLTEKGESS